MKKKEPVQQEQFKTDNLYIAATLFTAGVRLLAIEGDKEKMSYKAEFLFENEERIEQLVDDYYAERDSYAARALFNNWLYLKRRVTAGVKP